MSKLINLIPFTLLAYTIAAPQVQAQQSAAQTLLAPSGTNAPDEKELRGQAKATLHKAVAFMRSISAGGGYLWWYSSDLKERAGEELATPTQAWTQAPGTPFVGSALLYAYEKTQDPFFLDGALAAADALVQTQLVSGGWDYRLEFDPKQSQQWYYRSTSQNLSEAQIALRKNFTSFDDDNSQGALRFLMETQKLADASPLRDDPRMTRIRESIQYGLSGFMRAQYPNGAWPQRFNGTPHKGENYPSLKARYPEAWSRVYPAVPYGEAYTLNDGAISDCIRTMLDAYRQYGKTEYLESAKKAGDFLLHAQLPEPQPVWAQQYNVQMEPIWARKFEPPAAASAESSGAISSLLDLYLATGEDKYFAPLRPAVSWLQRTALEPGLWARFREFHTNTPLYFTKDYHLTYSDADMPTHYAFKTRYNIAAVLDRYEAIRNEGRSAYLKSQEQKTLTSTEKVAHRRKLEPQVRVVITAADEQGRWITDGRIQTRTFSNNIRVLAGYLQVTE
jgi:hypothetical protein